MDKKPGKSGLLTNLLVLFIVIIVCLVIAEVALRVTWKNFNPAVDSNPMMAYDDTLGWIGKPNYVGALAESGMTVPCRVNAWGFRDDPPPPFEQVADKRRLMFLGDSFMMGTGLEEKDRLTEVLERADSTLATYNFGIFGYSTDQELLVLKKFGPQIKPDYVFIFLCANDLIFNDSDQGHRVPKSHYYVDEAGELILGNVPVPQMENPNPVLKWLRGRTALGQMIYRVIAQKAYQKAGNRPRGRGRKVSREMEGGYAEIDSLLLFSETANTSDLTYYLLLEFKAEAERQGAKLFLFTTPSNKYWTAERNETPEEIRRVLNWCDELGISAVDLFPVFYQHVAETGESLYLKDEMHWNERGNQLAAEIVLQQLDEAVPGEE